MCRCAAETEWHGVAQFAVNKFQQKVPSQPEIAIFYQKPITKKAKSTDKTLSPNSSPLMPKLAGRGFSFGQVNGLGA